jgi:beta-galactosidase
MFEISGKDFLLNGKKFNLYSGAIHYFRVLPQNWEDRLLKLKLAGFNTVETYVCWNLHEPKKGEFNFDGLLDIVKFIETAQKVGLYAIVRPGPYICAEWDFGGLPAWLLSDENMQLRCNYAPFVKHVEDFYNELLKKLNHLQITKGGNIIAMQVENEYGSYSNDKKYLQKIEQIMLNCGVDVLLFTSDGDWKDVISGGTLPHIYKTLNFGSRTKTAFNVLKEFGDEVPKTCMEFWCGWFDHWGTFHHTRKASSVVNEINSFFDLDANFNMYMFHGGTNFNFWAGANHHSVYSPTVTSYDYSAPLSEWGAYTPTYHAIREVMHRRQGLTPPPLVEDVKFQNIGDVNLTKFAPLFSNLGTIGKKHQSAMPKSMEHFGQNFGYILYRTKIEGNYKSDKLAVDGVHDRAYIYINGEKKATFDRRETGRMKFQFWKKPKTHVLQLPAFNGATEVDILVDCMGRVNYGKKLYDRKGIAGDVYFGMQAHRGYEVYTLPFDNLDNLVYENLNTATMHDARCTMHEKNMPIFLKGTFKTTSNAECFVYLEGFTKGCVFVNGFNLGRFWNIGPQKALYLPGALLKEENEIIVFEQEKFEKPIISIKDKPNLGKGIIG